MATKELLTVKEVAEQNESCWVLVRRKQVPTLGACQKELLSSTGGKSPFGPQASWFRPRVPGDPGEHILRTFGLPVSLDRDTDTNPKIHGVT